MFNHKLEFMGFSPSSVKCVCVLGEGRGRGDVVVLSVLDISCQNINFISCTLQPESGRSIRITCNLRPHGLLHLVLVERFF